MNAHESDRLAHMLTSVGLVRAQSADLADVLIFQTCSIRDTAARKIMTHINQAKKFRRKNNPNQTICVVGCLAAHTKIDGADIVLGTDQFEDLVERIAGTRPNNAFGLGNSVVIMHGCDNFCTYCVVPHVRGRERSRPSAEILQEFKDILKIKASNHVPTAQTTVSPFKERGGTPVGCDGVCGGGGGGERTAKQPIYLLGQNVNSYRCPVTGMTFVELLDQICALDGDFLVNFMSSHPKDFDQNLVDCIARNEKIERNIHLPVQSGSNRILAAMNRGYTVETYLQKIDMLRLAVPDVRITTDIICGFVGETEADFNATVDLVKRVRFNAAFIFPYSRRTGTAADQMDGHLDQKEVKNRATTLIEIQRKLTK